MAKYKGIVHITSSINLSKNMINNAMWELGYDYVEKAALPQLRVAAEEGKKAAEAGFASAKYDGVNDVLVRTEQVGPRTMQLYAVGHALPYIEYGTGVFNRNNYVNKQLKDGKKYWFFSGKKRGPVQLTAGGERAMYKTGGYYKTRTYWEGPRGGKHYINMANPNIVWDGDTPYYENTTVTNTKTPEGGLIANNGETTRYQLVEEEEYVPKEYKPKKSESYITHGNPPNNVMRHARSVMLRQFNSNYKTGHSTYEP